MFAAFAVIVIALLVAGTLLYQAAANSLGRDDQ